MGTLWAPGAATIFVVATVTHQGWGRLFLPSLGLGVLGMGLSLLLTHAQYQIKDQRRWRKALSNGIYHRLLVVLGAVLGLLLVTLFLIHLGLESMTAVTVAGLMVIVI
ncbi:hypothetical protein [Limosilactobacillus fermentum]|uniref:hypothetical protein n=1 Tax=Limosilactobacillus fermentum TaxID=1613 RepID=UPI00186BA5DF|nr:hypothetical protein [Limosilactobacillus fermentum]MBE4709616.1 hypothetical protein [Limosilactobacillus fermentum]